MSQADSTTNVGISGIRLFNAYQKKNLEPFLEYITNEYIEEDNIKFILTEYSTWIAATVIPKYFDEDLKSNRNIFINAITLNDYLSKVIIVLKYKFPKHCDWEEPEWTARMRGEEFEKKCRHDQGKGNVGVSEYTKLRLYSKASPWLNAIYYHWMSNIDL